MMVTTTDSPCASLMVRLGMKGTQFALARKLMMKNLTGNSGWRYGAPPKNAEETPVAIADVLEAPATDTPPDEVALDPAEATSNEDVPPDGDAATEDTDIEED